MDLGRFLKQRDIIYTLCAASISAQIILIAETITNSCIMPIINKNNENNTVESFVVSVRGAKIEMGKILIVTIRLIIVSIILYLIYYLTY